MFQPIQAFYSDYSDLNEFLLSHGEYSLSIDVNHHFRKIFLLSCASYYETQIVGIVKQFVDNHSSDDRVLAFVTKKAIDRQYHTFFDWEPNSNVNKFLSLFGADFKDRVSAEIRQSVDLSNQARAFQVIGGERNKMVHENFLEYTLDKSFGELIELNEKASLFIDYLKEKFN